MGKLDDLRRKAKEAAKAAADAAKEGLTTTGETLASKAPGVASEAAHVGAKVAGDAAHVGAKVAGEAAQVGTKVAGEAAQVGAKVAGEAAHVGGKVADGAISAAEGVRAVGEEVRRKLREGTQALLGQVFIPMAGAAMRDMGVRPPRDRSGLAPGSYAAEYDEIIDVTVVLRAKAGATPTVGRRGRRGPRLSRAELAAQFSADPADIALVEAFADEHELTVSATNARSRRVTLSGRVSDMEDAFQLRMNWYEHEFHPHRGFDNEPAIPDELNGVVTSIMGISDRPQANVDTPGAAEAQNETISALELGAIYGFPDKARGAGETIAVLLLGGGYYENNLQDQMDSLGLPMPNITIAEVDGRGNNPCDLETTDAFVSWLNEGADVDGWTLLDALWTVECSQDIQLIAALAPQAEIVVFFAPNTDAGITNALAAVRDHPTEPTILSISWSQTERSASDAFLATVEEELAYLAMAGVTVCCASGDKGSYNGEKVPSVAYPASSPYAVGCGGTTMSRDGLTILSEVTWNTPFNGRAAGTGGGASNRFPTPEWQEGCAIPDAGYEGGGRGVPDVVAPADPHSGCRIYLGSGISLSAGTSASAPLWAAFIACVNSARDEPIGYVTPDLYDIAQRRAGEALRPVTEGNNDIDNENSDTWLASDGWNPCGGLGSPIGSVLFGELVALE